MKAVSDPEIIATSLDELRYQCCALLSEPTVAVIALNRSELLLFLGGLAAYERVTSLTAPVLDALDAWHHATGMAWLDANEALHGAYSNFKRNFDAQIKDTMADLAGEKA
jgi:hypothetical protein